MKEKEVKAKISIYEKKFANIGEIQISNKVMYHSHISEMIEINQLSKLFFYLIQTIILLS